MNSNERQSDSSCLPRWLILPCVLWLLVRLAYNGLRLLVPDEAYYWVWSRHPAMGYLDHPPMVAWVIRFGTLIFSDTEFGVRFGAAMNTLGTILVTIRLTTTMSENAQGTSSPGFLSASKYAAAILLLCPMTAVLGTIITPDTPACFFNICAIAAAIAATKDSPNAINANGKRIRSRYWLLFGIFMGLAMLSKYTAVLIGFSVAAALLTSSHGRRQFASPWLWLSVIGSFAVFSPVLLWNHAHDWASFRFQWHHGTSTDDDAQSPFINFPLYWLGQAAIYTPVLFVLGLAVLSQQWRAFAKMPTDDRILLFCATVPLLFFAIISLRHKPEANWPIAGYFPMTIILARWIASAPHPSRAKPARLGIAIAAAAMLIGHLPESIYLIPNRFLSNIPNPWEEMFGWRDYGQELDAISLDPATGIHLPVFATSYENAAEASFYMTGHPEVWTLNTDRPTAFDYFPNRPDLSSLGNVVCVTRLSATEDVPDALRGFKQMNIIHWQTTALGRVVRRRQLVVAQR